MGRVFLGVSGSFRTEFQDKEFQDRSFREFQDREFQGVSGQTKLPRIIKSAQPKVRRDRRRR
jgi:hypothetical protein